jgi:hypothetical protein
MVQQLRVFNLRCAWFAMMLLSAVGAAAQTTSIAGRVTDTSGAVLPGVTVEASSPVLIEKTRNVTTDGEGLYRIVDLRPGTYVVTFSLSGFSAIRREGIELTAGFTATVNADMRVGAVEETVTVSGASPTVDLHSTAQREVISREVLDAAPVARNYTGIGQTIPGMIPTTPNRTSGQDVGGFSGERGYLSYHGSGGGIDMMPQLDGMSWFLDGGAQTYTINPAEVQEFLYVLSSHMPESVYGGVRINVIPRDGGNNYSGFFRQSYINEHLQSNNLSDSLIAQGLKSVNRALYARDSNGSLGIPVVRDRLWLFASGRYQTDSYSIAGLFYPKDPLSFRYDPDPARPAHDLQWVSSVSARLTWQATPRNKFSGYFATQPYCQCFQFINATLAPQAAIRQTVRVNNLATVTWRSTVTSRLLVEAGMMRAHRNYFSGEQAGTDNVISATDLSNGLTFRSASTSFGNGDVISPTYKASATYVTGSHAIKAGIEVLRLDSDTRQWIHQDITYTLRGGAPTQLTLYNTPRNVLLKSKEIGLYAQDQWTIKRLTASLGLRFQYTNFSVPAQHLDAGSFVPARDYPEVSSVPDWKDVTPRFGVVYDLFGNGKTALKASANRYLFRSGGPIASQLNPVNRDVTTATRTWTETDGNYVPNCDLYNPLGNGECGPLSNNQFGKPNVQATTLDPELIAGHGVRPYNWEFSGGVQHELAAGVSLDVGYFRRVWGNFNVTDNLAVTPADYDPYCVAVPVDSRLPGGGGGTACGLYDLNPAKFGQVNNFVTFSDKYGKQTNHYSGIDGTVNARLPHRITVMGGVSSGTMTANNLPNVLSGTINSTTNCFVVDSPQQLHYCDQSLRWQTQYKALATIGLPLNFNASLTFQSNPGPLLLAKLTVTSDQVRASLGRSLSSGLATIDLIQPGTVFGDRMSQLDVKLTKGLRVRGVDIRGDITVYNLLNDDTPLQYNTTYGPAWRVPTFILPARLAALAVQVSF